MVLVCLFTVALALLFFIYLMVFLSSFFKKTALQHTSFVVGLLVLRLPCAGVFPALCLQKCRTFFFVGQRCCFRKANALLIAAACPLSALYLLNYSTSAHQSSRAPLSVMHLCRRSSLFLTSPRKRLTSLFIFPPAVLCRFAACLKICGHRIV